MGTFKKNRDPPHENGPDVNLFFTPAEYLFYKYAFHIKKKATNKIIRQLDFRML